MIMAVFLDSGPAILVRDRFSDRQAEEREKGDAAEIRDEAAEGFRPRHPDSR